jgi:hypothetical protein
MAWVCTKCGKMQNGRKVNGKDIKPGATAGGKCTGSKAGVHTYVKA